MNNLIGTAEIHPAGSTEYRPSVRARFAAEFDNGSFRINSAESFNPRDLWNGLPKVVNPREAGMSGVLAWAGGSKRFELSAEAVAKLSGATSKWISE